MLKRDNKKEIENGLTLVRDAVHKSIESKNIEEAETVINRELKGLVGLDINTVNTLSFSSIKELMGRERETNLEKFIALGEILRLRGRICDDAGERLFYYNKGLKSFHEVIVDDEGLTKDYFDGITKMVDELKKYELTLDEKEALFKGYELLHKFDRAEDVLFSMLKDSNNDKEIAQLGIDFYERLKLKDENILEKGNLPISEVKDSLEELNELI